MTVLTFSLRGVPAPVRGWGVSGGGVLGDFYEMGYLC